MLKTCVQFSGMGVGLIVHAIGAGCVSKPEKWEEQEGSTLEEDEAALAAMAQEDEAEKHKREKMEVRVVSVLACRCCWSTGHRVAASTTDARTLSCFSFSSPVRFARRRGWSGVQERATMKPKVSKQVMGVKVAEACFVFRANLLVNDAQIGFTKDLLQRSSAVLDEPALISVLRGRPSKHQNLVRSQVVCRRLVQTKWG